MQFDFVRFLFKKTFLRRKISLFSFETSIQYIFVPLQNTVNKIQSEETLALIFFFVQLLVSVYLRNSTVALDFFNCGSKVVFFHPAKGRPLHAVFIILSASTEMCSANWYCWPYFYCCSFWCFQPLANFRPYAIAAEIHGGVNFPFCLS